MLLSHRLRESTRDEHRRAERRPLVRDLMAGRLDRPGYALLLRSLHAVYAALERGFDAGPARSAGLTAFAPAEVRRTAALEADLAVHHGRDWHRKLEPVGAAREYADRLETLARADPVRLVAHAYVRYLGDLSGGRILGRRVAEGLGLAGDEGLEFYRFPEIDDADAFKADYRDALDGLDALGLSGGLVDEARLAFEMNGRLLDEVDRQREALPT